MLSGFHPRFYVQNAGILWQNQVWQKEHVKLQRENIQGHPEKMVPPAFPSPCLLLAGLQSRFSFLLNHRPRQTNADAHLFPDPPTVTRVDTAARCRAHRLHGKKKKTEGVGTTPSHRSENRSYGRVETKQGSSHNLASTSGRTSFNRKIPVWNPPGCQPWTFSQTTKYQLSPKWPKTRSGKKVSTKGVFSLRTCTSTLWSLSKISRSQRFQEHGSFCSRTPKKWRRSAPRQCPAVM